MEWGIFRHGDEVYFQEKKEGRGSKAPEVVGGEKEELGRICLMSITGEGGGSPRTCNAYRRGGIHKKKAVHRVTPGQKGGNTRWGELQFDVISNKEGIVAQVGSKTNQEKTHRKAVHYNQNKSKVGQKKIQHTQF